MTSPPPPVQYCFKSPVLPNGTPIMSLWWMRRQLTRLINSKVQAMATPRLPIPPFRFTFSPSYNSFQKAWFKRLLQLRASGDIHWRNHQEYLAMATYILMRRCLLPVKQYSGAAQKSASRSADFETSNQSAWLSWLSRLRIWSQECYSSSRPWVYADEGYAATCAGRSSLRIAERRDHNIS